MGIPRRFVPPRPQPLPSQRKAVFAPVPGRPGLKRFVGFEGDPGTRQFLGSLGSRVADRDQDDFPMSDGTPGPRMVYDESMVWGTNGPGDAQISAPVDPSTPVAPVTNVNQQVDTGLTVPFGVTLVKWKNPTTMQSVPILSSTPANVPVLSLNMMRNALVIQNNSTATSPDVAPNFYIGFNAQPQAGLALALAPGAGILFDIICPRDAVYVLIAGGTGASQIIQGAVVQGTYAPL